MEFEELIRSRYSTRKFSDRKLEDEKLEKILEAGRIAPTAKNFQPVMIYVAKTEEALSKIDLITPCRYGAPVCLLVCCDISNTFVIENFNSYITDGSIVATHMMLEAENLGVANIWIRKFKDSDAKRVFDLPENIMPVALLDLGYKAEDCPVSPNHGRRKPLDEIVKYI